VPDGALWMHRVNPPLVGGGWSATAGGLCRRFPSAPCQRAQVEPPHPDRSGSPLVTLSPFGTGHDPALPANHVARVRVVVRTLGTEACEPAHLPATIPFAGIPRATTNVWAILMWLGPREVRADGRSDLPDARPGPARLPGQGMHREHGRLCRPPTPPRLRLTPC